jgi:hypothetical protein
VIASKSEFVWSKRSVICLQTTCIKGGDCLTFRPVANPLPRFLLPDRSVSAAHRLVALALIIGIFWVLTLSASPQIHEWIHPDADHEDHDCAVTLFLWGGLVHSQLPPSLFAGPLFTFLRHSTSLPPEILATLFAGQRISERGPPGLHGLLDAQLRPSQGRRRLV